MWAVAVSKQTSPPVTLAVRPVAVTRDVASAMLGMSVDSFERYVQPFVCIIRRGSLRLVPVAELEKWAVQTAQPTLGGCSND